MHGVISFSPQNTLRGLLGENPHPRQKRLVARTLASIVQREKPFTVAYIENAYDGRQNISNRGQLYQALKAVWEHKNGGHPIKGAFELKEVWVLNGRIQTNSLILGQTKFCPTCGIPFVHERRKYCSEICRLEARRKRRRKT